MYPNIYRVFVLLIFFFLANCGTASFSDVKIQELNSLINNNKFEKADDLLNKNPSLNLNLLNKKEETLLEIAIRRNNLEGFIWLLKKGANPNILTKERLNSVMKLAAEHKNSEFLTQALFHKGDANLPHRFGENPLYFAAIARRDKNIDVLIANKIDGLHLDEYKNNTFSCLIESAKFKELNYLISKGFKPLNSPLELINEMVSNLEGSYISISPSAKNDLLQVVKYFNDNNVKVELLSWEQYKKKYKLDKPL